MNSDAEFERRVERLRQELTDEIGVELPAEALEEFAYCRFAAPHEGHRSSYGAIVWTADQPNEATGPPPLPSLSGFVDSGAPLDVLRTFADGQTAFVFRGPGVAPSLAIDPAWAGTERELAKYAKEVGVIIIQRLASGRVSLILNDSVHTQDDGVWLTRPTAVAYREQLIGALAEEHHATAHAILDLCVHTLSPARHGATLVWFPGGAADRHTAFLDTSLEITPPALSASDDSHRAAIAHALGQMDRACVIDSGGQLIRLNVTLEHAEEYSAHTVPGGTRHNSAGRYSASQPRAIVFVVSADGPVTVFSEGQVVAEIDGSTQRDTPERAPGVSQRRKSWQWPLRRHR